MQAQHWLYEYKIKQRFEHAGVDPKLKKERTTMHISQYILCSRICDANDEDFVYSKNRDYFDTGVCFAQEKQQNSCLKRWKSSKFIFKIMNFELKSGHKIFHSLMNRHDLGIVARRGSQKQALWLYILFRCISKFLYTSIPATVRHQSIVVIRQTVMEW